MAPSKSNKVLIILGPTASGKSDLAVRLGKKFKGEIISADSRQVYKGLNIGAGKITKLEMRGVPHHLLNVADPKKQFSVLEFKKMADEERFYIEERKRLPIIVGGSGFYIDAITGNAVFPEVPPNKKLREKLSTKTNLSLYKTLQKKDPARAKTIDPNNKVRLVRALEIIEALGKVPQLKTNPGKEFIFIGLLPKDLEKRISERLKKRMSGMILEAKKLRENGLSFKRMHELGLEYRYLALYLQKKITKEEMAQKLEIEIRRFAKRQMTWFKRNKKIKWFTPRDYREIEKYVKSKI